METMHFHIAHTKIFWGEFRFAFGGSLWTIWHEFKRPYECRIDHTSTPPLGLKFLRDFPSFLSFHVYSWICKRDIIHIGPLDEWTCQIVPLIISKNTTMTMLGWNQPIYTLNDFPLFFSVFINIHKYTNYANIITCIFDHGIKNLCLSFH